MIHKSSVIDTKAKIGKDVKIGPFCYIGPNVILDDNVELISNVHIEGNTKVEVKTERDIWQTTGNIAIEMRGKGKPSGISTTESSVWIHLLSKKGVIKGGFVFKVDQLRGKIKNLHNEGKLKIVMGGDANASQMALLPIKELWD